jgi:hypothetical protein
VSKFLGDAGKISNMRFKPLQVGTKNGVLEAKRAGVSLTTYGMFTAGSFPIFLHKLLSLLAYSLVPTKKRE